MLAKTLAVLKQHGREYPVVMENLVKDLKLQVAYDRYIPRDLGGYIQVNDEGNEIFKINPWTNDDRKANKSLAFMIATKMLYSKKLGDYYTVKFTEDKFEHNHGELVNAGKVEAAALGILMPDKPFREFADKAKSILDISEAFFVTEGDVEKRLNHLKIEKFKKKKESLFSL